MRHGFIKTATASPSIKVADCRYNCEKILSIYPLAELVGDQIALVKRLCDPSCRALSVFAEVRQPCKQLFGRIDPEALDGIKNADRQTQF